MLFLSRLSSLLTVLTILVSLSGCGGSGRNNELVMWIVGSEGQAKTIMRLSEGFTEKTGVKVSCQAISWGDAHSKYLTSIAGEVTPDIGTMGLTWGLELGSLGAMLDLAKEYPADVKKIQEKIFPGILESAQLGDSVYGIPFDLSEQIMYYRNDIIAVPPKTWEELDVLLEDLQARDKGMLFDWGSLGWIGYSSYLWQAGGDFYDKDHKKVTLDAPEAVLALEYFAGLYSKGTPRTTVPLEQGMRTGDYPLAISGNWKIVSLMVGAPEIKGKWSIATLPAGPAGKRTAFMGGRIVGIFSGSRMKAEAWEFIKFLFEPENQRKIYEDSFDTEDAYLPPNMDAWADLSMDKRFKDVLKSQAHDAKGPPPVLSWNTSSRFVNHAIQMVVLKGADASKELKKAAAAMQKELDRKRR